MTEKKWVTGGYNRTYRSYSLIGNWFCGPPRAGYFFSLISEGVAQLTRGVIKLTSH